MSIRTRHPRRTSSPATTDSGPTCPVAGMLHSTALRLMDVSLN
ncbi:MAG: hypothetical protein PGN15_09575 [Aeromicrobium erythreum]